MDALYIKTRLQAIKDIASASCNDEKDADNICDFCDEIYEALPNTESIIEIVKQRGEDAGRWLPCKIGDTVFCIENEKIWDCLVEKISISRNNGLWIEVSTPESMPDICAIEYTENDFGKTVFLTQSEAEQKLKEMESD